jgi:2-(1,2-epoxy-1,2-dihydrophenyl)acetyl-CoA isomerase
VRGGCHGIHYTMTALVDFIYVDPNASFQVPFMKSFQSPEGSSTYSFPQQLGIRRANEILLLDRPLLAKEAVQCGFVNAIVEDLGDSDWFDPLRIPAIAKLLKSDYRTIVNMKQLMNRAKDNERIDRIIADEAEQLI